MHARKICVRFVVLALSFSINVKIFASDDKNKDDCQRTWAGYLYSGVSNAFNTTQKTTSTVANTVGSTAESVRERLVNAKQISDQVFFVFKDFASKTIETSEQVFALMNEAGALSLKFITATPWSVAQSAYRIMAFSPSNDGLKNGIVIPLVGHLRDIRKFSKSSETRGELAIALNRLILFLPEVAINSYRVGIDCAHNTAFQTIGGTLGNLLGQPQLLDASSKAHTKLLSAVIQDVFTAITTSGLTLNERVALLVDSEGRISRVLVDIANEMGWPELDEEILAWSSKEFDSKVLETRAESGIFTEYGKGIRSTMNKAERASCKERIETYLYNNQLMDTTLTQNEIERFKKYLEGLFGEGTISDLSFTGEYSWEDRLFSSLRL